MSKYLCSGLSPTLYIVYYLFFVFYKRVDFYGGFVVVRLLICVLIQSIVFRLKLLMNTTPHRVAYTAYK